MGDAIRPHLFDAADGTAALPSYTFLNDRDTGFYRAASDQLGVALGGVAKLLYSAGVFAFQEATTISTTAGNLTLSPAGAVTLADSKKLILGTGADAELYYDGTNLVLNPRAVGTGYVQALASAIGATPTDVLSLWNATDAAAGAQQYSPALRFHGEGWKTDAVAASQNVDWRIYGQPVEGTANPTVNLLFQSSVNDAAFATRLTLTSGGLLTPSGNIDLAANRLVTTTLYLYEQGTDRMGVKRTSDDLVQYWTGAGLILSDGILAEADAVHIDVYNADASYLVFNARDSGVNLVDIARLVGAADPYFQIGRDDTGVALNAVTNMLVLQAGGGTGNEAAGFGFGLSVKLGNAASQVEERGSLDWVLVTATDASEDSRLDFNLMAGGAMNLAAQLSGAGVLDVDLSSGLGAATVGLFDDYDDAIVLRQGISERKLDVLEKIGVIRRKNTGSGWMMNVQAMLYLLAGGVYQNRQMMDERLARLERRMELIGGSHATDLD